MKVYLAARYSRHEELQEYAKELVVIGHTVTSRWIWGSHQIADLGSEAQTKELEKIRFANEDLGDLINADICVSFTEIPRSTTSRGGRHVEHGIALGLGKPCYIIGPRENVFHCLEYVEVFESWRSFVRILNL